MRIILTSLLLLFISTSFSYSQDEGEPCDSTYIAYYENNTTEPVKIPCNKFVVIDAGYYARIAKRYNLSNQLNEEQLRLNRNLQLQVTKADSLVETLNKMVTLQESVIKDYKGDIEDLSTLVKTSVANTNAAQKNTSALIKKYKKDRIKYFLIGGLGGIIIGVVTGAVLVSSL